MTKRPKYPEKFYQYLRKEAKFGCVICGFPIVVIHHIEPYREVKSHSLDNLVLLCKGHHEDADKGNFSKGELLNYKVHPYNDGSVKHFFNLLPDDTIVNIGSFTLVNVEVPLMIRGIPVISFRKENAHMLFSLVFQNRFGHSVLEIRDNIWEGRTDLFDLRYTRDLKEDEEWLTIKMSSDEPFTSIKMKNGALNITGKFYNGGHVIEARENGIFQMDQRITFSNIIFKNVRVGIRIA